MPIRYPPRREPRVLAVELHRGQFAFAVVDPWEIRSSGVVDLHPKHEVAALRRLVAREKPTALVLGRHLAARVDVPKLVVPMVSAPGARPSAATAAELFPEFAVFAPTRPLRHVILVAIAAALDGRLPSRTYATSRP